MGHGVRAAACILGLAVLLGAIYGVGWSGYDTTFALAWGDDVAHGHVPQFEGALHPTPHPLSVLTGVALSPLAAVHAALAAQVLTLAALALLAVAGFLLGRKLFGIPVGVLFALFLVSRPVLAGDALEASVDIPFLALVMCAAATEARRPRSATPVLVLLALAGLLRPEAWVLSAAYLAYLVPGLDASRRLRAAALAASAPLAWVLIDLAVTGDPLHSLHGTQELAERIERPRGLGTALDLLPHHLEEILHSPLIWLGLAGTLVALAYLYRRSLLPAAVLGLGLLGFLVLGIAQLPLLQRYLLVPSAMLALFAAVALAGWTSVPGSPRRRLWMAAAIPPAVWLALSIPDDVSRLDKVTSPLNARGELQRELLRLGDTRRGSEVLSRRCEPLALSGGGVLATVTLLRPRRDDGIEFTRGIPGPRARAAVLPATRRTAWLFGLAPPERVVGLRAAARSRSWVFYARC